MLGLQIYISYGFLCLCTVLVVLTSNAFFSLFLLFFFVAVISFLLFSLHLYFFMLIFLSVYAGAVLVLFVFVFMFLSTEGLFPIKWIKNYKGLFAFFFLFIIFTYLWNTVNLEFITEGMGYLPFVLQDEVAYFGVKLYIDFCFCFVYFGFLFFMVLIGVSQIMERE